MAGPSRRKPIFSFTRVPEGPITAFLDFVRLGRDLGFDRLWIPDQTYYADPFALLARVAAEVPGLELGLAVTNPYTRHPVQIARAAATVAEICGGRFLLGLGAGNRKHVIERLGLDGRGAAERVREATVIVRRLLAGERMTHQGHWTLKGVRLEREGPLDVPIFIATRNPRMLRVAGEVGDGVMFESLVSPLAQAYGLEEVRAGAAAAGREMSGMEIVAWQSVNITDDRAAGVEAMRPWVAYLLGMTTPPVAARMGIRPEVTEHVHQVFATGGPEAAVEFVGEAEVDRFVIVGGPEEVAARCVALIRGGATDFAVQVKADDFSGQPVRDDRAARHGLERFVREVKPLVLEQLAR
ncbi:MAG: LLM class flavin-dependent oxidoreductase [Armatimonadota bacterium]|nr:LLM class flavin-dependent oxidoreductase [Armatimonadota bacterium]